jgi:hypothetical protein
VYSQPTAGKQNKQQRQNPKDFRQTSHREKNIVNNLNEFGGGL